MSISTTTITCSATLNEQPEFKIKGLFHKVETAKKKKVTDATKVTNKRGREDDENENNANEPSTSRV
jgi:hypothetical protein